MKKFLLAPDSFKGTLDAWEICSIWEDGILAQVPDAVITKLPLADGGEGMVDAYLRIMGGTPVTATVTGPLLGSAVEAKYALMEDGVAVMEMAACAGLPLLDGQLDPFRATTYGVGEMIRHAIERGVSNILLGIGGSATNDCGIGMATALGYRFLDDQKQEVTPIPANFGEIDSIVPPESLPPVSVTAACDVDNPLCGPTGASYIFGPQKGVKTEWLDTFDKGLEHIARLIQRDLGRDVKDVPGAGAAGGLGAALLGFLDASLQPGIELLLDTAKFDTLLSQADIVFIGEGRMDGQSVHGKAPIGVSRRARKAGVPCIALCGSLGENVEAVYGEGVDAVFSAILSPGDFEAIKRTCREDMRFLTEAVLRLLLLG